MPANRKRPAIVRRLLDFEDDGAWTRFVTRYSKTMSRLAARWRLDRSTAEDAIQNALMRIVRSLPSFRDLCPARGFQRWVYTIGRNEMRRAARRADLGREPVRGRLIEAARRRSKAVALDSREQRQQLVQAIRCLAPRHRAVLILSTIKDMSAHEVAGLLEISTRRVSQLKWRAARRLRQHLNEGNTSHQVPCSP